MTTLNKILAGVLAAQLVLAAIVLTRDDAAAIGALAPVVELDAAQVTRVQVIGKAETPAAADGMRSGGLWDVLPRPEDLPDGFVFNADSIPVLFDALPGQAHEAG